MPVCSGRSTGKCAGRMQRRTAVGESPGDIANGTGKAFTALALLPLVRWLAAMACLRMAATSWHRLVNVMKRSQLLDAQVVAVTDMQLAQGSRHLAKFPLQKVFCSSLASHAAVPPDISAAGGYRRCCLASVSFLAVSV